jgi:hypothetical protein
MGTSEHKTYTGFGDALRHSFGIKFYLSTESFQNVRASGLARGRPVTVLGDGNSGSAGDERRRRGDVYGPFRVAAGAAGIYNAVGSIDLRGEVAHGSGETNDLRHRLPPHAHGRQQRGGGRRWRGPFHDGL